MKVPLPEEPHLDPAEHENVKEWVLAVSMDQKVEQQLPIDERMTYEGSLVAAGSVSPACVVTGYPVLSSRIEFARQESTVYMIIEIITKMLQRNDG